MQNDTKAKAKAAPSPRILAIETHNKAGFTGQTYSGISKPRNSGIAKAANTATSKATPRTYAQLTPRMLATLSELLRSYGTKPFPLCGIDRGQLAIFVNSGFIKPDANAVNGTLAGQAAKPASVKAEKPAKPAKPAPASDTPAKA